MHCILLSPNVIKSLLFCHLLRVSEQYECIYSSGANSGIGKCIALEIAKRGGTVHLVCRNPTTAEQAKTEIIETTKNEVSVGLCYHYCILALITYFCFQTNIIFFGCKLGMSSFFSIFDLLLSCALC